MFMYLYKLFICLNNKKEIIDNSVIIFGDLTNL